MGRTQRAHFKRRVMGQEGIVVGAPAAVGDGLETFAGQRRDPAYDERDALVLDRQLLGCDRLKCPEASALRMHMVMLRSSCWAEAVMAQR